VVPILCQINPVHTTPSSLTKIHFNIIHPPMLYCTHLNIGAGSSVRA
jgi:hypothetical protein